MPIAEMISSRPDVASRLNELLALAVRNAMFCPAMWRETSRDCKPALEPF